MQEHQFQMAASALEEKINKIKLQNEEIKRRHEEVEADKKNAAKLNALVQMVPSSDWPERKEPPEFVNPNKSTQQKTKPAPKEYFYTSGSEGKTIYKFAEGDGPPPDPKYNFLADSERDMCNRESVRDDDKKRERTKFSKGVSKKRGSGRDSYTKDYHTPQMLSKKDTLPEYEAWRAERIRIDEARINRQKTAEGNWRREWDNDKIVDHESTRKDSRFKSNDNTRREPKDYDKRHHFDGEHSNHGRINDTRIAHSPFKTVRGQQDSHRTNVFQQHQPYTKSHHESFMTTNDDRTIMTNKNLKISMNRGPNTPKGPVISVKVNSPSIAGTGRVGPRQKTRIAYSSHSETETTVHELDNSRSKSFDERTNGYKSLQPKSPYVQRKKENGPKSPHALRNETWKNDKVQHMRDHKDLPSKSLLSQKQSDNFSNVPKSPRVQRRLEKSQMDYAHCSFFQDMAKETVTEDSNENDQRSSLQKTSDENIQDNVDINTVNINVGSAFKSNVEKTEVDVYKLKKDELKITVNTDNSQISDAPYKENIKEEKNTLSDNNKPKNEINKLDYSTESNDSSFNVDTVKKNEKDIPNFVVVQSTGEENVKVLIDNLTEQSSLETTVMLESTAKDNQEVIKEKCDKVNISNEYLNSKVKNISMEKSSLKENNSEELLQSKVEQILESSESIKTDNKNEEI